MKASMSLEELKAQNVILHTRTVRENRGDEEGTVLELALNGCTSECLQAASDIMVAVAIQTAMEDGKLNPLALAVNAMTAERYFKKALLDWAKKRSSGSLQLYTFARNRMARAFYERHGFVLERQAFEPHWQLDDVLYRWQEPVSASRR